MTVAVARNLGEYVTTADRHSMTPRREVLELYDGTGVEDLVRPTIRRARHSPCFVPLSPLHRLQHGLYVLSITILIIIIVTATIDISILDWVQNLSHTS